jgi:branched-chain amino acid transport system permease protein
MRDDLQQRLNGLIVGGGYALFAIGFTLVFGIHQVLNLAKGAIFMTGAFIAFCSVLGGWPLWAGFLLAMLVSGLLVGNTSIGSVNYVKAGGTAAEGTLFLQSQQPPTLITWQRHPL